MVRLKKSSSLLDVLHRLEYGLAKDTYREALQAMRLLISDKSSPFTLVERLKTPNPVSYDERKLYLDHYKNVKLLYGGGPADKPVDLYKLPSDFPSFRDALVITHSQISICPLPRKVYCSSFFAITDANHLIRLDSETGELLDDIYLGSTYKFTTLNWETHGKRLVLQTNIHRKNQQRDTSILQAICLITIFPLEFVALFELETGVVGEYIKTANVGEGLLILGPQSHVRLYDLYELISEENRICDCKLHETKEGCSHGPIGTFPSGLPINFIVKRLPSPLFDVTCFGQSLEFGATPYHYIYQSTSRDHQILIADARNDRVIANIESESIFPDLAHCFFHWDDTGRIIHQRDSAVDIHKLINDDSDGKKMKLEFTLKCDVPLRAPPKLTERQMALNRPRKTDMDEGEILKLDYENETEYLIILGVSSPCSGKGCIRIFDNLTGHLVRHINLDIKLKDWAEYILIMDIDAIVLIEAITRNNTVFIYKLDRSSTG